MQRAKRVCFYCLHKLWLALAIVLVLLAVCISVLRYSLPYADNYKHHIEQLISQRYSANVSIGSLSAGWQKFGPALLLNDVSLYDNQQQLQLHIDETRVRLDFWRSLLTLQLTAQHFELSGLQYYVAADTLLAQNTESDLDSAPVLAALETLFFQQLAYFSVVDSQLIVQTPGSPDLTLNISQLDWTNSGNRHQGFGELSLAGVTANTVSFVLDLYGPTLPEAFGQLYLESDKLDVLPWFASLLPSSQKLQQASLNFKAWGRVDQGLLRRIQVELANNSISWLKHGETQQLELGQGQLMWQPGDEGWSLFSGDLTLQSNDGQWPGLQFQLHRNDTGWQASLNQFALQSLSPLLQFLADDIAALQQLTLYQPEAKLHDLQFWQQADHWFVRGHFAELNSVAVGDVPGVQQLHGDFLLSDSLARVTLRSAAPSQLNWDTLFPVATAYDSLSASVFWRSGNDNQHWQLSIPNFKLQAKAMQLDAQFKLDEQLQILARLQHADASEAGRFFPQPYMPEQVRNYLQQAILAGTVSDARVLWFGEPSAFPYRDNDGHFQVVAQLSDGQFAFDPQWPVIHGLEAELLFDNAAMHIHSQSGDLAGVALGQAVTARIDDLFAADSLFIDIRPKLDAAAVTSLMLESPLADSLGKTLQHLAASGEVSGDVLLDIGLKHAGVRATGTVVFKDTALSLAAPQMDLRGLKGSLQFDNEQIDARDLLLQWRGLPVIASVQGRQQDDGYQLALSAEGEHEGHQLLNALHSPAADLIEGPLDWQLQLTLGLPQQGFSYQANIQANLAKAQLRLPAPFAKAVAEQGWLRLSSQGDANASEIQAHLDDKLHFHARLAHDTQLFSHVQINAGAADTGLGSAGFHINVALEHADFIAWLTLLEQQLAALPQSDGLALFPPLQKVQGKISRLIAAPGIALTNTVFELSPQPEFWQLQLNGTEIASRWQLHKDWQNKGIIAELDYLHLPLTEDNTETDSSTAGTPLTSQRWWLSLPPLQVRCADCAIGPYRLGQVRAQTRSEADRWLLTEFEAAYKRSRLTLSGSWQQLEGAGRSAFTGRVQANNLGSLLQEYQLTSAISGSSAEMAFNLDWPGAPNQFELAQLGGDVSYKLGEGSLTEVSDQGARLFSIFSLDSLLRKLRLDFRDVFAKGFFYNGMSGKLAIANGIVQTSDATVDGVPGNLAIQGYADLVNREMDYQMAFSPKVTSSLPVIIAWMVNPATGLAALALDEVFQSAEVISKINFTVTGSFEQPVVTEVNRHSKEVPVPVRVAKPDAVSENPASEQKLLPENQPHG